MPMLLESLPILLINWTILLETASCRRFTVYNETEASSPGTLTHKITPMEVRRLCQESLKVLVCFLTSFLFEETCLIITLMHVRSHLTVNSLLPI
ncbi:MAG: hypothetical protein BYD32DRAFT_423250 [Podila humilis]|nr:MAG: hypothetical protein BYD32DRAFT_423248 [Podila humilis]KAI9234570.1 MAG: hypothetical protein BYD32DRAFT_423250 [Podila humilis]